MSTLALACRLGAGSTPTLPRRVRSILRKYGATLIMPGPAVPILGPERIVGNWSTPAGYDNTTVGNGQSVTVTAGTAVGARAAIALQPLEVGKTYRATARCLSLTATTGFYVREGSVPGNGTTTLSSPGLAAGSYYEATFAATRTDYNVLASANVAASYTFADISVREVLGYQNTYSSFIAGNYKESTGNTLAGIDQQVGLVIDASQDAGPELMVNGNFSVGLAAWAVYANGGTANATGGVATVTSGGTNGRIEQAKMLTANKTYIATAYVTLGTAPNMQLECIRGAAGSYASLGKFVATTPDRQLARFVFVATGADVIVQAKSADGAGTFTIEQVSLRELPGIHASQSTSGYRPYLRQLGGVNLWQFDGVDDRQSLSVVPFEMADDFFGVFGYRIAAAADVNLLALRNTGQTNPAIVFGVLPNGAPRFWARNDAGTFVQTQGVPRIGVDTVLSGRKYSATMECRVEGVLAQSAARPANALTVNNATLCASVATTAGGFFNGNLHGAILGKGAITAAELLVLEKFMARLQGRSL